MKVSLNSVTARLLIFLCFVFSPAVYSASCSDQSPSVKRGLGPRGVIEPEKLTKDEIKKILGIFESIKGDWKGDGHQADCVKGDGKDLVKRTEKISVELSVRSDSKNEIDFEFDLYLPEKKVRRNITDGFFIDENYLMFKDGPFEFKVTVLYLKGNYITLLRKTRLPSKGRLPVSRVTTIAVYGKNSIVIEDVNYLNGLFATEKVYQLKYVF